MTPRRYEHEGRWSLSLRSHQLDDIVETALSEDLAAPERRSLLLEGLPRELSTQLRAFPRPLDQLRHDVIELAQMDVRVQGHLPPLAVWLGNAARLSGSPACHNIFLSYWARLVAPCLDHMPPSEPLLAPMMPILAAGDVFDGRFKLIELLSDGSWSQVWRGTDLRLRRDVALKILRPEYGSHRERRARFLRGARHMASLRHPNVARVLELVEPSSPTSLCYYWMEYLHGGSLEVALASGVLDAATGLRALLGAAEGLAAAHACGLLHRDIKPSNILLDEHGIAKLTDFDLIKSAESCGATQGGLGTWAYTAPEVIADGRQASVRSDVYSLGRTALFILFAGTCGADEKRALPCRWPSLQLSDVVPRLRCSTEVLKAVLAATSGVPPARPASVDAFVTALRIALDEEHHLLARRFKWLGERASHPMSQEHLAFDLQAGPGATPTVEITTFTDEATRRLEALFEGFDWTRLSLELHHESIPAVRARGRDGRGRYWLATAGEEEPGRRLAEAMMALTDDTWSHSERGTATLIELVGVVRRVCAVVSYAHRRGVVHRDLRAEHVVMGPGDRLIVSGWATAIPRAGEGTQLRSERIDVISAGCMLARLLLGTGTDALVGFVVDVSPPVLPQLAKPPETWTAAARELSTITAASLTHRFESMDALGEALDHWADCQQARRSFAEVQPKFEYGRKLRRQALALDLAATRARDAVRPWDHERLKRRWWLNEDTAKRLRRDAAAVEQSWLGVMTRLAATLPEARTALLGYYADRLHEADKQGDVERVRLLEGVVAVQLGADATDRVTGRRVVVLDGRAVPSEVWLETLDLEGRRAQVVRRECLGRGRRFELALEPASYLAVYDCYGHEVRFPFLIRRREQLPYVLRLPMVRVGALAEGDVFIAAGECQIGGDALATDALPARTVFVDAFVMKRHPVMHREYLAFLDDLWRRGRRDEAIGVCPRKPGKPGGYLYGLRSTGFTIDPDMGIEPDAPVNNLCWIRANAFAEWFAALSGEDWRLPHEIEWEKAARGVDGRHYPWGNGIDEGWANMANSHHTQGRPVSVKAYEGRFPIDCSPYGVRGLGGNMRTWCRNPWRASGPRLLVIGGRSTVSLADVAVGREGELIINRGGAFAAPRDGCRSAGRFADLPASIKITGGIRLVRPLGPSSWEGSAP